MLVILRLPLDVCLSINYVQLLNFFSRGPPGHDHFEATQSDTQQK
jgi:hypothetical protein